jgi:hypothetical protein
MGSVGCNGGTNGNGTDHTLPATTKTLRVGIIGIGEVAQSIHLPTLALLSHLFTVISTCDISPNALTHCSQKFHVPRIYESDELCADPEVDVAYMWLYIRGAADFPRRIGDCSKRCIKTIQGSHR